MRIVNAINFDGKADPQEVIEVEKSVLEENAVENAIPPEVSYVDV